MMKTHLLRRNASGYRQGEKRYVFSPSEFRPLPKVIPKQQHDLLRGLSPLTDLDDEEELEKLRGELKERGLEIAALRNELAGMKQREEQQQQAENRTRFATPATTMYAFSKFNEDVTDMFSVCSHNHPGGLVRTQSGSFISRVSKHPTPAPSSPGRDAESDERLTDVDAMDLGHHEEDFVPQEGQDMAALSEIEDLRNHLKESAQHLLNKNEELDKQTKSLSDIQTELESLFREHGALQKENSKLSTEMADIQQAWKRTQEAAAKAHEELRGSESLINKLQDEATVTASRLSILETTNENLCRERDGLKEAIEQAKEAALRSESAKEDTETRMRQMSEKLATLERSDEEQKTKIDNLNARLGQVATEARTLQERNVELETAVTASKLEASEKTVSIANLGNVVEEKERQIKELSAQLHTAQVSADILNSQYAEAQTVIKTLQESLEGAQSTVGDYKTRFETVDAQLKGERELAEQLNEQLSSKASEVNDISERLQEAQRVRSDLEAELSDKNGTVQRLMNDLHTARVIAENAEKSLLDAEQRHVQERTSLESQISGLNTSMTIANTEIENVGARLSDVSLERDRLKVDMEMKTTEASQLNDLVRAERQEKSTLQAELQKYKDMYEDLEEELLDFKAAKTADERTITGLRKSFSNIRQSQQKLFDEIDGEVSHIIFHGR